MSTRSCIHQLPFSSYGDLEDPFTTYDTYYPINLEDDMCQACAEDMQYFHEHVDTSMECQPHCPRLPVRPFHLPMFSGVRRYPITAPSAPVPISMPTIFVDLPPRTSRPDERTVNPRDVGGYEDTNFSANRCETPLVSFDDGGQRATRRPHTPSLTLCRFLASDGETKDVELHNPEPSVTKRCSTDSPSASELVVLGWKPGDPAPETRIVPFLGCQPLDASSHYPNLWKQDFASTSLLRGPDRQDADITHAANTSSRAVPFASSPLLLLNGRLLPLGALTSQRSSPTALQGRQLSPLSSSSTTTKA